MTGLRVALAIGLVSMVTWAGSSVAANEAGGAPSGKAAATAKGTETLANRPITRTLRSISVDDLVARNLTTGVYEGSPKVIANRAQYEKEFYSTLASYAGKPIAQQAPPPCDQPQPTGYDAENCRLVMSMFTDVKDPVKREQYRAQVRRGADVWFKGTFGNQDYFAKYVGKTLRHGVAIAPDYSHWLDTRKRKERYAKYGMMNDPDCTEGDATTFWMDRCKDAHATGVIGLRKYYNDKPPAGFDPYTTPYQDGELTDSRRFVIGQACAVCHASFDPTNPPADPANPKWENITGHIGNQFTNNGAAQLFGAQPGHFSHVMYDAMAPGQVDTTSGHMDYIYNPGTQNNVTDLHTRPLFTEKIKHPITGEVKEARTRHVLKGGEDSVGEHLALLRVYLNIGVCYAECNEANFPVPGTLFGDKKHYKPFSAKQCYQACEPWNHADAKMLDLAVYLASGGPFYLRDAVDVDGTPGRKLIKDDLVPRGRAVYAQECASCHSSKVAPESVRADKVALGRFYGGHIFGREADWRSEVGATAAADPDFSGKHLAGGRPAQFAKDGIYGQDWLGNEQPTAHNIVGTNRCRAMHGNQVPGAVWSEFSSETYKERPAPPGSYAKVFNPMLPLIGGKPNPFGINEEIDKGRGYYRNVSLLSIWAHAPYLHNNMLGPLTRRADGGIGYTVKEMVDMFEGGMRELLTSDNPSVTPHRPQKVTRFPVDFKIPLKAGGEPRITVKAGTPAFHVWSVNPFSPLFLTCADEVENKGHQFGVDLSPEDKNALIEFLKTI